MKRHWELEELIDHFTFLPDEYSQLGNKTGETRLGFAVLLKFFQFEARFPNHRNEIPKEVVLYIAKQLKIDSRLFKEYDWSGRSIKYHRSQIRDFFGFKEVTDKDIHEIAEWLSKQAFYNDADIENLKEEAYKRFREQRIEPPKPDRLDRMTRSALYTYETQFFQDIFHKLSKNTITKMDNLINELTEYDESDFDYDMVKDVDSISFNDLRSDPGRIGTESVLQEIIKLKTIQMLELPENLFSSIPQKIVKKYKQRALSEDITELRRHPEFVRYALLSAFFWLRYREITDNLIEILIQIIHRIGVRAERKVDKEILKNFKRVNGKTNLLFPVVNETTLKALVKEFKNTGTQYRQKVHTVMRASYATHYRRMFQNCSIHFKFVPIMKFINL